MAESGEFSFYWHVYYPIFSQEIQVIEQGNYILPL